MSTATAAAPEPSKDGTWFGHPKGLFVLFGTEMWERFSYYGMRSMLVLYLISYLQFQPSQASSVYKWYTSLVYLTPLLGGFLADRFLGIKRAIVIGGVLMGIGHFLMAFEALPFLYSALAFLILGNGFFKPNISTLVGKMYKQGDARRDGAFSIFYLGINVGAGLAGPICGALRNKFSWHVGFAAAGVGMMIGLITFLLGSKTVLKAVDEAGNSANPGGRKEKSDVPVVEASESQPGATGLAGAISAVYPFLLMVIAVLVPALYLYKAATGQESWLNVIMPAAFALLGGAMGLLLLRIKGASRNKSTVIFVFFIFVVLFWMAFEQAGNALSIWAEFNTQRQLGPITTTAEDFQFFNSGFIWALSPVFAILWVWFEKRGRGIPTPVKLLMGLIFTVLAFATMTASAQQEDKTVTRVKVATMPGQIKLLEPTAAQKEGLTGDLKVVAVEVKDDEGKVSVQPVHAGRMLYDGASQELVVRGTLPPFARMDALRPTVDGPYLESIGALEKSVKYATDEKAVTALLGPVGSGFEVPKLKQLKGSKPVWLKVTPATNDAPQKLEVVPEGTEGAAQGFELSFVSGISPLDKAALVGAGSTPEWRAALDEAAQKSDAARVSGWWLVLQYFFATLAELCISPVGLSLVTKLAPVRFASLFMGVWFLTNSVAQYVGGALGELWGTVPPTDYFFLFIVTSAVGALVLLPLIWPIRKLMHEVT